MGELCRIWQMKGIMKMDRTQLLLLSPICSQNASAGVERLLLGNKCDMEAKRKVQKEQADKVRARLGREDQDEVDSGGLGCCPLSNSLPTFPQQLAREHGIRFFETSAKSSMNVDEVSHATPIPKEMEC